MMNAQDKKRFDDLEAEVSRLRSKLNEAYDFVHEIGIGLGEGKWHINAEWIQEAGSVASDAQSRVDALEDRVFDLEMNA